MLSIYTLYIYCTLTTELVIFKKTLKKTFKLC